MKRTHLSRGKLIMLLLLVGVGIILLIGLIVFKSDGSKGILPPPTSGQNKISPPPTTTTTK